MFGKPYEITFNNEFNFKTALGGILTIFSSICLIFCFLILGSDIIYRQNPNYSSRIISSSSRPNLTFDINMAFIYCLDTKKIIMILNNLLYFHDFALSSRWNTI